MQEKESLEIIYQDQWLVAVNKPSGLLVHRTNLDRHETRFAVQLVRNQLRQRVYPVHRLDKPTSGVLLFALDPETAKLLALQFREHRLEKRYLALLRGWAEEQGTINYPLVDGPIKGDYGQQRAGEEPRPAVTAYRTLSRVELPISDGRHPTSRYSLVEARPTTGRRHQLRRHFKHIFHPIIGDTTYGDGRHNRRFRQQYGVQRLLLHAERLDLSHPLSGEHLALQAVLPAELAAVLQATGLKPKRPK